MECYVLNRALLMHPSQLAATVQKMICSLSRRLTAEISSCEQFILLRQVGNGHILSRY